MRLKYGTRRNRVINYNAEIPFEKRPAIGFYDTSNEVADPSSMNFKRLRMDEVEQKRRDEEENRERKKDKKILKQRKENDIPAELINNEEPAKKRSKLVLPSPQISDTELEQIVKLGKASEAARESVVDGESMRASDTLLQDYSVTPGASMRTPRTPMAGQDKILQEAQNIMALQNTDTPLKGGLNTPLHNDGGDFSGITPARQTAATPNTVLTTPFRTKEGQVGLTPSQTPGTGAGAGTPGSTPVRDKLAINTSDSLDDWQSGTPAGLDQSRENAAMLKMGLASLPAPKNDYEIVVPEDNEDNVEMGEDGNSLVEDQSDVDNRRIEAARQAAEAALAKRSSAVKRDLPRPVEVNHAVLRPMNSDPPLNELQKAEELIKREMILMLHHDCLESPTLAQMGGRDKAKKGERGIINEATHRNYMDKHPWREYSKEELEVAKQMMEEEREVVKAGMQHGDLSLEAYTQVWEECLGQVLYLPGQQRYTRAHLASKKDRIESLEKQLETNRSHMTKEAKKASKTEKKLKILTGGYQSRAAGLIKQLTDSADQLENSRLEMKTFEELRINETNAIPRRLAAITEDVKKQTDREKELQASYREILLRLEEARVGNFREDSTEKVDMDIGD